MPEPSARRPRQSDARLVSELLTSAGDSPVTPAVVEADWRRLDLTRDAWIICEGSVVLGYAAIFPDGWGEISSVGALASDDFDRLALRLVEGRAAERGDAIVRFLVRTADARRMNFLVNAGYTEESRYWRFTACLPRSPRSHRDTTIRRVAGRNDEQVVFDFVRETKAEPIEFDVWKAWVTAWTFDPTLWLIAFDDAKPVGVLVGWGFPDEGYVKHVALHALRPDRAVGVALLDHAFSVFAERGFRQAAFAVSSDDPDYVRMVARDSEMHLAGELRLLAKEHLTTSTRRPRAGALV